MVDVVIIGAGPAGISAALYAKRANKNVLVIYKGESNLEKAEKIDNYYGFENGITGKELYDAGIRQAKNLGVLSEPDIFEYTLNEGDKFIVCASDGVWEYLSNDDVMNTVKDVYEREGKAEEACEVLIKKASSEWRKENSKTMDDISCAILFLNVK